MKSSFAALLGLVIMAAMPTFSSGESSYYIRGNNDQHVRALQEDIAVVPTHIPSTNTPIAPSVSPVPTGALVPVLVQFATDAYFDETGWAISSMTDADVIAQMVPTLSSLDPYSMYSTDVSLNKNAMYHLTLSDSYGDGLFGNVTVYLGEKADPNKILAYYDGSYGSSFTFNLTLTFVVSEDATLLFTSAPSSWPTIAPTLSPTAPTVSPSPTQTMTDITVYLELDSYISETGWKILDTTGKVLAEDSPGAYVESNTATVSRVVSVPLDVPLTFVVVDSYGDGLVGRVIVYLGNEMNNNNVLAYYDGTAAPNMFYTFEMSFTADRDGILNNIIPTQAPSSPSTAPTNTPTSPTISPVPTGTVVPVLIEFTTDAFATETGWVLTSTSNQNDVVAQMDPLSSVLESYTLYSTSVSLNIDAAYELTLSDSYGDGLFGNVTVYLGEKADPNKILAYYDGSYGSSFTFNLTLTFVVSEDATLLFTSAPSSWPTIAPTLSPTAPTVSPSPTQTMTDITVYLELDSYISETGWKILDTTGKVLAEDSPGAYVESNTATVSRVVSVPLDVPLTFVVVDSYGDGLVGRVIVYLGNEMNNNNVLAYYDGTAAPNMFYTFEMSFTADRDGILNNIIPTQAPSSPSTAPTNTPTSPTISPVPTGTVVPVLIEFTTDAFATETGWVLTSTSNQNDVVAQMDPLSSVLESHTLYSTSVSLNVDAAYELTLSDSYGDGLFGNVTVYLGEKADPNKILAYYDGSYGSSFTFNLTLTFVVSEDAIMPLV